MIDVRNSSFARQCLDILEYRRQLDELADINRILNNNLQNSKIIILELESQLYDISEEIIDDDFNNNNLDDE